MLEHETQIYLMLQSKDLKECRTWPSLTFPASSQSDSHRGKRERQPSTNEAKRRRIRNMFNQIYQLVPSILNITIQQDIK